MARFRLRFLLQEFDLAGPEVLIGRSSECHITIEDPLISRKHARIDIRGGGAIVVDLGSRNGVRVNGRLVKGEQPLKDGDRLRLGTQELLFTVVGKQDRPPRPTGYMKLCHACGTPYPEGAASCPACGAPALADEDTMTGPIAEPKRSWTFHLLGEVIDRALASGRAVEAERLMRRAAKEIDERLAQGDRLEAAHVALIASSSVRLARLVGSSDWVAWALTLHRRHDMMLSDEVMERLEELDTQSFPDLHALIDSYLHWYRAQQAQGGRRVTADLARLVRLERFRRR
ncbi:MAG: hypothetical protein OHK0013_24850 [Sandaracinaceae bacterium]